MPSGLGRVERMLFLLRFISSTDVRRVIRAETNQDRDLQ
jgi:hypothetical protein